MRNPSCRCQNDEVVGVFIVSRPTGRLKMMGDMQWVTHAFTQLAAIMESEGCGLETNFTIHQGKERGPKSFRAQLTGKTRSVKPPKADSA